MAPNRLVCRWTHYLRRAREQGWWMMCTRPRAEISNGAMSTAPSKAWPLERAERGEGGGRGRRQSSRHGIKRVNDYWGPPLFAYYFDIDGQFFVAQVDDFYS